MQENFSTLAQIIQPLFGQIARLYNRGRADGLRDRRCRAGAGPDKQIVLVLDGAG